MKGIKFQMSYKIQKNCAGLMILQYIILLGVFNLMLFSGCSILRSKKTYIEPVDVIIIDESRVENTKIRHVFKEFLVKDIVNAGKTWLTVYNHDSLNIDPNQTGYIEYMISFDIMQYSTFDIEHRTDEMLASVKLVNLPDKVILCSFIESAQGKKMEQLCAITSNSLATDIVKALASFRRREIPEAQEAPEDTSLVEHD